MTNWINTLVITEEASRDKNGKPTTIFYIREKPFRFGYSYQSTALTENAAQWVIKKLQNDRRLRTKQWSDKLKTSFAWRLNRMHRYPGMDLINGLKEKDLKALNLAQLKRCCILASGRAIQYKANDKHNIAASWLSIAATIYRHINDRIK